MIAIYLVSLLCELQALACKDSATLATSLRSVASALCQARSGSLHGSTRIVHCVVGDGVSATNSQGACYGTGCSEMVARTIIFWCLHALRTQLTWLLDLQFALARSEKASNKTSMATQSWPRACGFSNVCGQKTGPKSSRGYICTCRRISLCTQTDFLRESSGNSCKICKLCTARWSYHTLC